MRLCFAPQPPAAASKTLRKAQLCSWRPLPAGFDMHARARMHARSHAHTHLRTHAGGRLEGDGAGASTSQVGARGQHEYTRPPGAGSTWHARTERASLLGSWSTQDVPPLPAHATQAAAPPRTPFLTPRHEQKAHEEAEQKAREEALELDAAFKVRGCWALHAWVVAAGAWVQRAPQRRTGGGRGAAVLRCVCCSGGWSCVCGGGKAGAREWAAVRKTWVWAGGQGSQPNALWTRRRIVHAPPCPPAPPPRLPRQPRRRPSWGRASGVALVRVSPRGRSEAPPRWRAAAMKRGSLCRGSACAVMGRGGWCRLPRRAGVSLQWTRAQALFDLFVLFTSLWRGRCVCGSLRFHVTHSFSVSGHRLSFLCALCGCCRGGIRAAADGGRVRACLFPLQSPLGVKCGVVLACLQVWWWWGGCPGLPAPAAGRAEAVRRSRCNACLTARSEWCPAHHPGTIQTPLKWMVSCTPGGTPCGTPGAHLAAPTWKAAGRCGDGGAGTHSGGES